MRLPARFLTALTFVMLGGVALAEPMGAAFPDLADRLDEPYRTDVTKLDLKTGKVTLEGGQVTLDVPGAYYFLDRSDARYVLETLWGNPPDETTLGMIFPADKAPIDNTWGIEISFDPMGYVSDEDAAQMDFDALLATMKEDAAAASAERVKAGFEAVELKGWATPPHYDATERKLYWAKILHFGTEPVDTLNYNIRALGRRGVLVVNFIAGADQLREVERAAPAVLKMISFNEGHRYADFTPGVDSVAAVGIGGLIAGKVLAGKAGLIALFLAFAKKGAALLILPVMWVVRKLRRSGPDA